MGKTDANLHGRQQCSSEEMDIRWQLALGNPSPHKKKKMLARLEELACTTQLSS